MIGITVERLRETRTDGAEGCFTQFNGESFYKISHYDEMPPFFMTIVSSSDVWNYIWSNGGLSAGRINSEHAIFPYYTADKISDNRHCTGSYTALKIYRGKNIFYWEPFSDFQKGFWKTERNLYKNSNGSKVYFEEYNQDLALTFQYGWTSSERFGLVRHVRIINNSDSRVEIAILDGCRNMLPACITSSLQNDYSVLLDAYKKTDLDSEYGIAVFSVTSIVTDKAEPNEGLYANISWFSQDNGSLHLSPLTPEAFRIDEPLPSTTVIKGERPAFFLHQSLSLDSQESNEWFQVFDTSLDITAIVNLQKLLGDRHSVVEQLKADIDEGGRKLENFISAADGIQNTADMTTCIHHKANVMFNIMRGGLFAGNEMVNIKDFVDFCGERNKKLQQKMMKSVSMLPENVSHSQLSDAIVGENDRQFERLFLEYMPITFSRRHGDPSRPWNKFSIELKDSSGNPKLNYQGNWRDIFQNWEALGISYPFYIKNMIAKFLNACTPDGYNPYRITRKGIDWEVQEPDNPWSNIGYWGDHQIIYLAKLMEWQSCFDRKTLFDMLNSRLFSSGNVPYRIKSYEEIIQNPRSTIVFDNERHNQILKDEIDVGSDARLLRDKNGDVVLVTMTDKLLILVLAKLANLIPGGGIWLNTQRPEWNDANNALAGYGLSMVTLYYLRRFLVFLKTLYSDCENDSFSLVNEYANFFREITNLYSTSNAQEIDTPDKTRHFVDAAGKSYEKLRNIVYSHGYSGEYCSVTRDELINGLSVFLSHIEHAISLNRRPDGLYHSYNTMSLTNSGGIEIHKLYEMLEGQVAVLSSGYLKENEVIDLCSQLKNGALFREDQYSYILYPEKELPHFLDRNIVVQEEIEKIELLGVMLKNGDNSIINIDANGCGHFHPSFRNVSDLDEVLHQLQKDAVYDRSLLIRDASSIYALYEKVFKHQSFTGRSGTFYAYEGLGSIYWHMVSKLMLAVLENALSANASDSRKKIIEIYYDIRKGIGFNKSPKAYGAFPTDPYSHTPAGQGAKQPGMTGQVKEEIITRWYELGIRINGGIVSIDTELLQQNEFFADGTLSFTWCEVVFMYHSKQLTKRQVSRIEVTFADGTGESVTIHEGNSLTEEESKMVFSRTGAVRRIDVFLE